MPVPLRQRPQAAPGPITLVPTERPPQKPRRRGTAWLWLGFVAFLFVVSVVLPFPGCGVDRARDASVRANLNTVRLALEQYAADHDGHYPPSDRLVSELTRERRSYLPGNQMPRSPWATAPQTVAIWDEDLPTARQIAATGKLPDPGQVLGKGEAPNGGPRTPFQFGAILYDLDPKSQTYVLYGVGQRNKRAQIVADEANGAQAP